jgi:hypothetical protein
MVAPKYVAGVIVSSPIARKLNTYFWFRTVVVVSCWLHHKHQTQVFYMSSSREKLSGSDVEVFQVPESIAGKWLS